MWLDDEGGRREEGRKGEGGREQGGKEEEEEEEEGGYKIRMNHERMKTSRGEKGQDNGMRVAYGLFLLIEPNNTDYVQVYIFQLNKKMCFF